MNVIALIFAFVLPFLGGLWIFLRSGHSVLSALRRALWMALYAVIPVMAFAILAGGTKQLTGFNIFPLVPVVVLLFFVWVSRLRPSTPQQGQIAEVVTNKPRAYCQIRLPSGERVLISCAQSGIKIMRLAFGGLIPTETVVEWPISQIASAVAIFGGKSAPTQHPLDAIKNTLLHCQSIADIERLCAHPARSEAESSTSRNADLVKAQELVNRYCTVLAEGQSVFHSETLLPAPKEQIKDALVLLAKYYSAAGGGSAEKLQTLRAGYASLADFVPAEQASSAANFDALVKAALELQPGVDNGKFQEIAQQMSGGKFPHVEQRSVEEFSRLIAEFDRRVAE